jgi:Zn-dependent peptidase ImmA (M78 family)/DNA-binding XRE family transcriptional regulator
MGEQIRAVVKPELLVWARKSARYQVHEAAKKANVSAERLTEWESGDSAPTINQLRMLANIYKRPLAVFFLPEPPRQFDAMRDFRRLPDAVNAEYTPELVLAIRRARFRREIAVELAEELEFEIPRLDFDPRPFGADGNRLAEAARKLLNVTPDEQLHWRDKYEALNAWSAAVERVGVLVFQTSGVSMREMRGFSVRESVYPVIVVNAKDSPRGRVFTILHEFAHLLMHSGGLCDTHETRDLDSDEQRLEVLCNHIAGAMLVPESALLDAIQNMASTLKRGAIADAELTVLSHRFAVSQEVILRRLLTLGRVSVDFYRKKRDELHKAYEREREQEEGFAPHHQVVVRDLGKQYIRIVLGAYHQEAITSSDVSDYLGTRLKHLPKIERAVFSGVTP